MGLHLPVKKQKAALLEQIEEGEKRSCG